MSEGVDEIIDEIRKERNAHAASLGYDLGRIVEDLQRQERKSGRKTVTRSPRKPAPERSAK